MSVFFKLKIYFFLNLFFCLFLGSMYSAIFVEPSTNSFVISKKNKKKSTNVLKEQVGQITEKLFDQTVLITEHIAQCHIISADEYIKKNIVTSEKIFIISKNNASIQHSLGLVQKKICNIQRVCLSVIKKIIDNAAPFKKVRNQVLEKTVTTLNSIYDLCNESVKKTLLWQNETNQLKESIAAVEKNIVQIDQCIKNDDCLKVV